MAVTEPRKPSVDPQLLRDYRHGRLGAEAEHAFEQRLLGDPALAEDLAWDEHLEQVAGTWALESATGDGAARAERDAEVAASRWRARVPAAVGAVLAAGAVLFGIAALQNREGASQVVRFDPLSETARPDAARVVFVDAELRYLTVEVPAATLEGREVVVTFTGTLGPPLTFHVRVRGGFASAVVPMEKLPSGAYEVRVEAGPPFDLVVMDAPDDP